MTLKNTCRNLSCQLSRTSKADRVQSTHRWIRTYDRGSGTNKGRHSLKAARTVIQRWERKLDPYVKWQALFSQHCDYPGDRPVSHLPHSPWSPRKITTSPSSLLPVSFWVVISLPSLSHLSTPGQWQLNPWCTLTHREKSLKLWISRGTTLLKWDPSTSLRTMAPTEQAFASSAAPQKLENIPIDQYVGAGLSRSVPSDSLQPHGLWPTRLLCPRGFSRPEYWSGLPCPPPGDLPDPGTEPRSPTLQADSVPAEPPRKPQVLKSDGGGQARPQALVLCQTPRWFQCGVRFANQVNRGGLREPAGSYSNTNSRPRHSTDHLTVGSFSPHVSPA